MLLESKETQLQWVLRRSLQLDHRSVPEYLGIPSEEPGVIHSTQDLDFEALLSESPVDVIVDFSSADGLEIHRHAAAQHGIMIVNAISSYEPDPIETLQQLGTETRVMYSPNITLGNITLGINFLMLPFFQLETLQQHCRPPADNS